MYSLTVWTDPARYAREFGSTIALDAFEECFRRRAERQGGPIPSEVEQVFLQTAAPEFEAIRDMVTVHRLAQIRAADEEIAAQAARHADAVQRIAIASTPAARHGRRQAELKIAAAQQRRQRVLQGPAAWDAGLIFPNTFAPILVQGVDGLELRPMRYRCRPSRLDSKLDRLLNGAHVARRDSLEGTWREEFGISHGVVVAESFFESVRSIGWSSERWQGDRAWGPWSSGSRHCPRSPCTPLACGRTGSGQASQISGRLRS